MTQRFLNTTNHSVAWIVKRHQADELEIKPPFQRNPVWSDVQKSYLIDTILHEFPIPEIYMQEFTDSDGNDRYIVVDGQQRLRACIEFIENGFALSGQDIVDLEGMNFEDLTPDQRQMIYNYNFVVRKLPDMPDEEIKAIFRRLNRNVVALNAQELRHATYSGQFIELMEDLADDARWTDLAVFSPNDIRRMLDIEFISELSIGNLHGPQNKKGNLDKWYATYETEFDQRSELKSTFNKVIGEILTVLPDIPKTRWRKKSDFYSLFLVLAENVDLMPFSRDERDYIGDMLFAFGGAVDSFIADPEMEPPPPAPIRLYTLAVERAASDLANRRARATQLRDVLGFSDPTQEAAVDAEVVPVV